MPVSNAGAFFPVPDVKYEASNEPETVDFDAGNAKSTGWHEVEIGDITEDHTEIHSQEPSGAFPNPEPYTVELEGFSAGGNKPAKKAQEVTPKEPLADAAQAKVVRSPRKSAPKGTGGAEKK